MKPVDIHSHRVVTRLVQVRHHREKSQRQLAAATGMTQSAVWAIESGRRPLRLSEAVAICAALEVDLGAVVAEAPLVLRTVEETVFE